VAWLRWRASRSAPLVADIVSAHNDFYFGELGLDRAAIEARVLDRCRRLGIPFTGEMQSVHYAAFEGLAASGFKPQNVLEIGTLFGYTASFLADLFPDATIYTIDLPPDDPLIAEHLPLSPMQSQEVARRLDRSNIRVVRANSAFLFRQKLPLFDLIWQDTGDRFPDIAWEFYASFSLLKPGGWLFVDDVRKPDNPMIDRLPWFIHVHQTLSYYEARMPEKFRFLLKRNNAVEYGADPKYVGFLKLQSAC
jgi:predicted O-methyltransferase YrrM